MNKEDENQDIAQNPAYNPFPEPQTIPSGWDTSEFIFTPQPVSAEQAADIVEGESK
jgi:hypothetical protein